MPATQALWTFEKGPVPLGLLRKMTQTAGLMISLIEQGESIAVIQNNWRGIKSPVFLGKNKTFKILHTFERQRFQFIRSLDTLEKLHIWRW